MFNWLSFWFLYKHKPFSLLARLEDDIVGCNLDYNEHFLDNLCICIKQGNIFECLNVLRQYWYMIIKLGFEYCTILVYRLVVGTVYITHTDTWYTKAYRCIAYVNPILDQSVLNGMVRYYEPCKYNNISNVRSSWFKGW